MDVDFSKLKRKIVDGVYEVRPLHRLRALEIRYRPDHLFSKDLKKFKAEGLNFHELCEKFSWDCNSYYAPKFSEVNSPVNYVALVTFGEKNKRSQVCVLKIGNSNYYGPKELYSIVKSEHHPSIEKIKSLYLKN